MRILVHQIRLLRMRKILPLKLRRLVHVLHVAFTVCAVTGSADRVVRWGREALRLGPGSALLMLLELPGTIVVVFPIPVKGVIVCVGVFARFQRG